MCCLPQAHRLFQHHTQDVPQIESRVDLTADPLQATQRFHPLPQFPICLRIQASVVNRTGEIPGHGLQHPDLFAPEATPAVSQVELTYTAILQTQSYTSEVLDGKSLYVRTVGRDNVGIPLNVVAEITPAPGKNRSLKPLGAGGNLEGLHSLPVCAGRRQIARSQRILLCVVEQEHSLLRVQQPNRLAHHPVQQLLQIERRSCKRCDASQTRLAYLTAPGLLVEMGILNCDRRLANHGLKHLQVTFRPHILLETDQLQCANKTTSDLQRDADVRSERVLRCIQLGTHVVPGLNVRNN